jgi:bla regulator protein BlaR1
MLCFLYVIAIGTCLALAGAAVERTLAPTTPRRWLWVLVIALSLLIPPVYQAQHSTMLAASATSSPTLWGYLSSFDAQLMQLWGLASLLLFTWAVIGVGRVWWEIRRNGRGTTIVDGIPVLVTETSGPATIGLWQARVLLPRWVLALPRTQRQYVVRHEEEHRNAHDAQLLFITSLLLILTPWNLALWWQLRRLSLAVELDCDNRVVAALGNAPVYGNLLFTVAQATGHAQRLQPGFTGGVGILERRLKALLAPRKLPRFLQYMLPLIAIGLLVVVLSAPHPVLASGSAASASTHHATQR